MSTTAISYSCERCGYTSPHPFGGKVCPRCKAEIGPVDYDDLPESEEDAIVIDDEPLAALATETRALAEALQAGSDVAAAVAVFADLLSDSKQNFTFKIGVCEALAHLPHPHAVPPLITLLTTADAHLSEVAADTLVAMPQYAVNQLLERLNKIEPSTCAIQSQMAFLGDHVVAYARVLGRCGDPEAIPALLAFLLAPDLRHAVYVAVAGALELLGWQPEDDDQRVAFYLASEDWNAIKALGAPAVHPLLRLLSKSRRMAEAIKALGEIGDPVALPTLYEAASGLLIKDNAVQLAAVQAIAAIIAPCSPKPPAPEPEPEMEPDEVKSDPIESQVVRFISFDPSDSLIRREAQNEIEDLLAEGWRVHSMTGCDGSYQVTVLLLKDQSARPGRRVAAAHTPRRYSDPSWRRLGTERHQNAVSIIPVGELTYADALRAGLPDEQVEAIAAREIYEAARGASRAQAAPDLQAAREKLTNWRPTNVN